MEIKTIPNNPSFALSPDFLRRVNRVGIVAISIFFVLFLNPDNTDIDPYNNVMVDPNLVGIRDPADGRCVLAWFDTNLLGKPDIVEILTYEKFIGKKAIAGNFGAKQKYSVEPYEIIPADGFLSYVGEGQDGAVYLNVPEGCVPGGTPNIQEFIKIGPWGPLEEGAFAVMPKAEGNWGDTGSAGMIQVYPKGYKPIQP